MTTSSDNLASEQKLREVLRRLVSACNYRDAVIASHHTDKLDLAVEGYVMAIRTAQKAIDGELPSD